MNILCTFQYSCMAILQSQQVSLSILDSTQYSDLSNAVVWMVSICPLISKPSSPFTNPVLTVPSAPTAIGITMPFIFHSLFVCCCFFFLVFLQVPCTCLSFRLLSIFICGQSGRQSPLLRTFSFLLTITKSDRLVKIRWLVYSSKSHMIMGEFFASVLADGFPLESEKQKVYSSLQESS